MALEVGIVGLPNVGKSTLFRALTRVEAEAANYPFCTIEPNVGMVPVRDPRLQRLTELVEPNQTIPAMLRVVDIAGLVKGASQGEGLGNQFLSHIRQVDAIAHVVRCFADENVVHVDGSPDPIRDIEVIQTELILSDLEQVERKLERLRKQAKGNREAAAAIPVFEKMLAHLGDGKLARSGDWATEELVIFAELSLITSKPSLYIANVSEEGLSEASEFEVALRELAAREQVEVIPICAQVESELAEMEEEEARAFMEEMGIRHSGTVQLARSGYQLLNQITYFTAGKRKFEPGRFNVDLLLPRQLVKFIAISRRVSSVPKSTTSMTWIPLVRKQRSVKPDAGVWKDAITLFRTVTLCILDLMFSVHFPCLHQRA